MKNLKWNPLLCVLLASVVFFSCSDDEDDISKKSDTEISAEIVGTWRLISYEGWEIIDGERDDYSETYTKDFFNYTFETNGSGYESKDNYDSKYPFEWSIKNKILTLSYSGDKDIYTIIEISSDTLVLQDSGKDSDGDEWYDKETYKRIK